MSNNPLLNKFGRDILSLLIHIIKAIIYAIVISAIIRFSSLDIVDAGNGRGRC